MSGIFSFSSEFPIFFSEYVSDHRAVVAEILGEKNGTAALVFANLAGIDPY